MFRELTPERFKLTARKTQEFRDIPQFFGDRKLSRVRVNHLKGEMRKGDFFAPEWIICSCLEDGTKTRVNGNHTSYALLEMEKEGAFPSNLEVTVRHFECDTQVSMAKFWSKLDSLLSSRSKMECISAAARTNNGLKKIPDIILNIAAAGITYATSKGADRQGSLAGVEANQNAVLEHHQFVQWLDELINEIDPGSKKHKKNGSIFKRKPIVAAIFNCYSVSEPLANSWWREVRDASDPWTNAPSRVLNGLLKENFIKTKIGATAATRAWTPLGLYTKCIIAWDAHVNNMRKMVRTQHREGSFAKMTGEVRSRQIMTTDLKYHESVYWTKPTGVIKFAMPLEPPTPLYTGRIAPPSEMVSAEEVA